MFIEHFWEVRWDGIDEPYDSTEVMHRPYVDVFFSPDESGIQGTFRGTRTYTATPGSGRIFGARFRPGAFHVFWPGRMSDLQDKVVALSEAFAWADDRTVRSLVRLEDDAAFAALADKLRGHLPPADDTIALINEIVAAVETRDDVQTVAAVAAAFGKSERWLQQTFRDYVGVGLKWLLQRHRLLAAARKIRETAEPNWADIAYDLGYSSQQHFITDFKTVLGATPVQYKQGITRG